MMSLKLLVFVIGLAAVSEIRAQQYSSSEDYRICCNTRASGNKCLEAFPGDNVVRVQNQSNSPDQKWKLSSSPIGGNTYMIKCDTANQGPLNMEAFPGVWLIRMKPADILKRDQQFLIEPFSPGSDKVRISVNTEASGWKSLEAYPGSDLVRPLDNSLDQDQQWEIKRW